MERDVFGSRKSLDGAPLSRSGRAPQWVIDETLGVGRQPAEPWRAYYSSPSAKASQSRNRRRRRWVRGITALVLLGFGAAAWLTVRPGESYRFILLQKDGRTPVAYSPCQPIRYVIQRHGEPAGGAVIITDAVARVSQATGLQFVFDGVTSEGYSRQRRAYQPSRYGDRWAPVLVAWVNPEEGPDVGDIALGSAGSQSVRVPNGQRAYVTGAMALDPEKLKRTLEQPNGKQAVQAVVMHEFGHIVGLDHVNSKSELMYPQARHSVTDFGAGDLTGLAALGKGTCSSEL